VCAGFGAELREGSGEAEHAHLPVSFLPTVATSRLVNSLNGVSSRHLRPEFPDLRRHYRRAERLWLGVARRIGRRRAHLCPALAHQTAEPVAEPAHARPP